MIGYIYKITSPSTDKIYIGSTTQTLIERFKCHKYHKSCNSKLILTFSDSVIELLEEIIFTDKKDLFKRERYYIELNQNICVNVKFPSRTKKEWNTINKERISIKQKEYNLLHREELKKNAEIYRIENADKIYEKIKCECGVICGKQNISLHKKSKKHLNYLSLL